MVVLPLAMNKRLTVGAYKIQITVCDSKIVCKWSKEGKKRKGCSLTSAPSILRPATFLLTPTRSYPPYLASPAAAQHPSPCTLAFYVHFYSVLFANNFYMYACMNMHLVMYIEPKSILSWYTSRFRKIREIDSSTGMNYLQNQMQHLKTMLG